jgi:alpha-methylacyl-CoA racemase
VGGPLTGVRVIEVAGIGPGPFAAMVLADMGADVVRVDRPTTANASRGVASASNPVGRGRRSVVIDLKQPAASELVLRLVESADALIEGFRPGVAERLGIGPEACLARNPRLVYGRITGWGQDGPLAARAGHDINYIALAGTLGAIGRAGDTPVPPLNLLGDYGGGGMLLVVGVLAGIIEAARSGRGQVVDAAMVDGAALLATVIHGFRAAGDWRDERGVNVLDTGAHFYEVYETADGGFLAVGAIEPQFYDQLLERIGLDREGLAAQSDRAEWPALKERFAAVFRTKTRDEWSAIFEGSDACVTPVLSMAEVATHPHLRARETFREIDGVLQPGPAPRFARTPCGNERPPPRPGQHTQEVLLESGLTEEEITVLSRSGTIH